MTIMMDGSNRIHAGFQIGFDSFRRRWAVALLKINRTTASIYKVTITRICTCTSKDRQT